jgi:hypothetical protein
MIPFRGLNADYSEKEIRKCQNLFQITPKSYPNLVPGKRYDRKIPCIPDTKSIKNGGRPISGVSRKHSTIYCFAFEFTKIFTMM